MIHFIVRFLRSQIRSQLSFSCDKIFRLPCWLALLKFNWQESQIFRIAVRKSSNENISFVADNSDIVTKPDAEPIPRFPAPATSSTSNPRPKETMAVTSRGTEASALSALLVPGGQVPSSGSVVNLRPLGRSTITKVASPYVGYNTEQSREKLKSIASAIQRSEIVDETTIESQNEAFVIDDQVKVVDNSPFNWYFQHYNDTNLEPYVGIAYSGAAKIDAYQWFLLLVFSILI